MKSFYILVVYFCLLLPASAQKVFTRQKLLEDIKFLEKIVLNTNPVLSIQSKLSLKERFSDAIKYFPLDSADVIEFSKYISLLKLGAGYDSHANIFYDAKSFPDSAAFFPTPIYVIENKILVNSEQAGLPYGSIIQSINGIDSHEILDAVIGKEGPISFRKYKLNSIFSFIFFLRFGPYTKFNIVYRKNLDAKKEDTLNYPAIDLADVIKARNSAIFPINQDKHQSFPTMNIRFDDSTRLCYMQLNSFGDLQSDSQNVYKKFESLFDSAFMNIRSMSTKFLVLDIRGNQGGIMDVAGLLLSYLNDSPFYETFYQSMIPAKYIPLDNLSKIDNALISSKSYARKKLYRFYDGFTTNGTVSKRTVYYKRDPTQFPFTGEVVLLVDGGTYSAAAYFTSLFKFHKRGLIIGSQVGGSIRNMTAGHFLEYTLPNTSLRVTLPIMSIGFDESLLSNCDKEYIEPDVKLSFERQYQYFLKKVDWGKGINRRPGE